MSIPSKDKARARHPKCIPGKGQKFTLTMVNLPAFFELERRNCNRVAHLCVYIVFCRKQILPRTYSGFVETRKKSRTRVRSQAQPTDTHTKHKIQPNTSYNEISSIKCDKNKRLQKHRLFYSSSFPKPFFFASSHFDN